MTSHYKIFGPAVINFSGGRSSGFMLHKILDAWDGKLPENVIPIFTNTGKERGETLDFIHKCSQEWNVKIVWLEYSFNRTAVGGKNSRKHNTIVVNHNSASRNGQPFDQLIESRGMIPNAARRICTSELKVETVRRYVKSTFGWQRTRFTSVLGIRFDEKKRWDRIIGKNNRKCLERLPMVDAKHDKNDVENFWRISPFDLKIDSSLGNCDLCFLKRKGNLISTMRNDPSLAHWWIKHEEENMRKKNDIFRNKKISQFNKGFTYKELYDLSLQEPQTSLFDYADGLAIDCFCTD